MHRQARIIGFLLCWAVATSAITNEPTLSISMVAAGQDGPTRNRRIQSPQLGMTMS